jgi:hypothetical protein
MLSPGKSLLLMATIVGGLLLPIAAQADSVAVTDHSVVGLRSRPGMKAHDVFIITLEVEYALSTKPKGVLRLAVDKDAEMSFSPVDEKEILANKRKRRLQLTARLEGFTRDTLRGIVLIQDAGAPANAPPLAMTGVSLELRKFRDY